MQGSAHTLLLAGLHPGSAHTPLPLPHLPDVTQGSAHTPLPAGLHPGSAHTPPEVAHG